MNLIVAPVAALTAWWSRTTEFLPRPFQVALLVLLSYFALRAALKHVMPVLGKLVAKPFVWVLRLLAWTVAVPEYAITSTCLRRSGRIPTSAHNYGDLLAHILQASETGAVATGRWMQKERKAERIAAVTVLAVICIVNYDAYQSSHELPLSLWWDSVWGPVQDWMDSLEKEAAD